MNMHPAVINNQLQANVLLFRNMITPFAHNDMQPRARGLLENSAGAAGVFSSPGSVFSADSYFGIRSTPVLPQ